MNDANDTHSIADVYDQQAPNRNPVVALLSRYVSGRKSLFGVAAVSTVLWRLANLVPPYLLGVGLDAFFTGERNDLSVAFVPSAWIPDTNEGQFLVLILLFAALVMAQVWFNFLRHLSWRWFQQSVLHELRTDAFSSAQNLDVAAIESEQTGDVMSVLNNDVNQLRDFLDRGAQDILQTGSFFVVLLGIMLGLHWQLTLVCLVFVPLMVLLNGAYQRLVEPRYDDRRSAVGKLNSHIQTAINGISTVKAFTNEEYEYDRLTENSREFWRADWRAAKLSAVFYPTQQFVSLGVMMATLVVGGWWAISGPPLWFTQPLSPGTFVTFYFFGQMFVGQSSRLGDITDTYSDAKSSAKRVFGLVHYPSNITDSSDATDIDSLDGDVEFSDVDFTYPGNDEKTLDGIDFRVEANEYVGLVGPTGAGKSTVMKLLLRFYEPNDGSITVDGTDIEALSIEHLRDSIGYVGQESALLDATVKENIAYGDHDAEDDAIVRAAKRANAHEFITELSDGYDTEVGERGVRLSGGQRQRIAIARAILKDPDVLLLDEATSHVDNRTELFIQQGLSDLIEGRTTIAIAHRLSTVRDADQIIVMDDGEIIERGPHEELLSAGRLYSDLWRLHTGEADSLPSLESDPVLPER